MSTLLEINSHHRQSKGLLGRHSLDSIKHPLTKIYIEPTTLCNLKCRTCIRNSWDETIGSMDMAIYKKLLSDLREFPSLHTMAFWGIGEPLAHPEIANMIALAHEMGLETEVITNGHLLDRDLARRFIEAGLDTLVVSLDGTTQTSYENIRLGGNLMCVDENVKEMNRIRASMHSNNPIVGLEFVMMKSNIDQIPYLAEKARIMDATFIVLSNLLPCTEDMKNEILYWIPGTFGNEQERPFLNPDLMLPRMDMHAEYLSLVQSLLEKLNRCMPEVMKRNILEEHCPFIQKGSAAITWCGDVSPCIPLMHSHKCYVMGREKFVKRHWVGNVKYEKMADIWNKKNYREFREQVSKFDFSPCMHCGGCDYVATNEEDCLGNIHPVCGDCLWSKSILLCP
jgi:MoaA/NifB/PqqE/SkfB family radical SAM enzyme